MVLREKRFLFFNYIVIFLFLLFALVPIIILFLNSFKSAADIGLNPLGLPKEIIWENYINAWKIGNFSTTLRNTLIIVTGTVTGILFFGGMAAYSIAKLNISSFATNVLIVYFLVVTSLPIQLFLIPLFFLWKQLHLTNNLFGIILIYIGYYSAFSIFLLRSFIVKIPSEFIDSARVDGAGEMQIFFRIIMPLSWPAFLTVGLIISIFVWNEFLIATVFLTKKELSTLVTSYYNFALTNMGRNWALTSAASMMTIFPIIIIFLIFQRRFIEGITQGGLKG